METTLYLDANHKALWIEAGKTFPGEQLDRVVQRALIDLPTDCPKKEFYEVRRMDAPYAFDSLLKIQNTGLARRHFEVIENTDDSKKECREVLRIEATLFDLIMQAILLLLDVFLRVVGINNDSGGAGSPPVSPRDPIKESYIPTWKRQPRIGHDSYGM